MEDTSPRGTPRKMDSLAISYYISVNPHILSRDDSGGRGRGNLVQLT